MVSLQALTAKATCQALLDIFSRFDIPELVGCNQGLNFTAGLTKELSESLRVQVRFPTPEHPQSNGLVEHWNGTLKAMLRHVIHDHERDWVCLIPCVLRAYRQLPQEITGVSPPELM